MSKILKIIVNLVVLFSIIVAAALLVPPFAGVDTVMNDNTGTETNLPIGSVAYGKSVNVKNLEKKDKIIYSEGSSSYIYEIQDMDSSAGIYQVKDVYSKSSETETLNLQKSVPKVMVVVPLIGYAAIALQSKEGLIVVGVGIVLLIILFVLSELWRKDKDDEDEEEEDGEEEEEKLGFRERRRLKKEEKRRLREEEEEEQEDEEDDGEEEEEKLSFRERRRLKKEEKHRRKLEKKGLPDEEEDDEEEEELPKASNQTEEPELQGYDDAMKDAMSSIAMGVASVSEPEQTPDATRMMPDAEELEKAAEEAAQKTAEATEQPESSAEAEQPEESQKAEASEQESENYNNIEETETEEIEMPVNVNAVPKSPSVQELLAKAQAAGEKPEVKTDEDNEITLLDYSDIL